MGLTGELEQIAIGLSASVSSALIAAGLMQHPLVVEGMPQLFHLIAGIGFVASRKRCKTV